MAILETIRDSPSGQLARWYCPEWLPYPEEQLDSPQRRIYNQAESIKEKFEPPATPSEAIPTPEDQDTSQQNRSSSKHDAEASAVKDRQQEHDATPGIHRDGHVICDWYSASDPDNPLNWSRGRKLWVVANICYCSFVVYMSAPIWTPGEELFMELFGTSYEYTSLGLALFVFGYGVGPLLFAPLSEIASVGRNLPYVTTFIVYMLVTIPTALAGRR
ncbi:MFS general substrate transporter [Aureobasidium sp. EXF-10728]|nr:MFS general substrate transporter [Aureobasidium sp. EXF-10728]